jgi:hypothetical protein
MKTFITALALLIAILECVAIGRNADVERVGLSKPTYDYTT